MNKLEVAALEQIMGKTCYYVKREIKESRPTFTVCHGVLGRVNKCGVVDTTGSHLEVVLFDPKGHQVTVRLDSLYDDAEEAVIEMQRRVEKLTTSIKADSAVEALRVIDGPESEEAPE